MILNDNGKIVSISAHRLRCPNYAPNGVACANFKPIRRAVSSHCCECSNMATDKGKQ